MQKYRALSKKKESFNEWEDSLFTVLQCNVLIHWMKIKSLNMDQQGLYCEAPWTKNILIHPMIFIESVLRVPTLLLIYSLMPVWVWAEPGEPASLGYHTLGQLSPDVYSCGHYHDSVSGRIQIAPMGKRNWSILKTISYIIFSVMSFWN